MRFWLGEEQEVLGSHRVRDLSYLHRFHSQCVQLFQSMTFDDVLAYRLEMNVILVSVGRPWIVEKVHENGEDLLHENVLLQCIAKTIEQGPIDHEQGSGLAVQNVLVVLG